MKAEEFVEEVIASKLVSSDFVAQYEFFQKYQEMVLNTLREFHRVCEKNGINYHVTYGSLIGLIRDGGQIPWDYDIDTFVPVSQKAELMEALRRDLSNEYYAMCPEFDESCRHYILRVCPKGLNSAAVHLDVFYYCGTPEGEKERRAFTKSLLRCSQIRYSQKVNIKEEAMGSAKKAIKLTVAKIGASLFSGRMIDAKYERLIHQYPIEESKYVVSADFFAGWYLFPTEMLTETVLYTSDIGEFRIPKDYDSFLNMVYGDYRKYPALTSGIQQVTYAVKRFKRFENNGNGGRG